MKRVLRVGYPRYATADAFSEHVDYLKLHLNAFDEIALFTEDDHNGYREPSETESCVNILKQRIPEYRKLGFKSVGINLLCTLGHLEEAYDCHDKAPFGYMMNRDGIVSQSCICPSSQECLDYIYNRYAEFAECGADFIWIDDDVRAYNHGVVTASDYCFCDNCIAKFNSLHNTAYNREDIVRLWSDSNIRSQYINMQIDNIKQVLLTVKSAVWAKHPEIRIGLMNDAAHVDTSLVRASGAVMCRPGGGFYTDTTPIYVFEKAFRIHSCVLKYPPEIIDIQYEYECFNFQSFEKSKTMTELETTLAVMSGCNGSLYSMSWFYDREDLTCAVEKSKKMWDELAEVNKGCTLTGVYCTNSTTAMHLINSGIPVTNSIKDSVAAFVIGDDWKALSDSDISRILSLGVYTDADGAKILTERGFGDKLGAKISAQYNNGMCERFTEHSINGRYKNFFRNVFMTFGYYSDAYTFELSKDAECISMLEDVKHRSFGPSAYIYENNDGNRVCVDGYMMPIKMKSKHKKEQLLGIFNYLSRGRMPISVDKDMKIVPTVSCDGEGNMNVMLINATFDPSGSFECTLNTDREVFAIGKDGNYSKVTSAGKNGKTVISIDNISAWGYVLLTTKKR